MASRHTQGYLLVATGAGYRGRKHCGIMLHLAGCMILLTRQSKDSKNGGALVPSSVVWVSPCILTAALSDTLYMHKLGLRQLSDRAKVT